LDIVGNVLDILLEGPIGKTRLATRANLDTRASQKYFEVLLRTGLIVYEEKTRLIRITPKGIDFMREFQRIKRFLEDYGFMS
jgi:predicted transcriptional regulator